MSLKEPLIHSTGDNFTLYTQSSTDAPSEFISIGGRQVLRHDAIATLFLATIKVSTSPKDTIYFRRRSGRWDVEPTIFEGIIGTSQRPFLPLFGTGIMYVALQIIGIVQQWRMKKHGYSAEITLLHEICGGSAANCVMNSNLRLVNVVCSISEEKEGADEPTVAHVGYLPERLYKEWQHFLAVRDTKHGRKEFGVVDGNDLHLYASHIRSSIETTSEDPFHPYKFTNVTGEAVGRA